MRKATLHLRNSGALILKLHKLVFKIPVQWGSLKEMRTEQSLWPEIKTDSHFSNFFTSPKTMLGVWGSLCFDKLSLSQFSQKLTDYFSDALADKETWPKEPLSRIPVIQQDFLDFVSQEFPQWHRAWTAFLSASTIPASSAHGDFFSDNILTQNEQLRFIDWSAYQKHSSRYFDLMNCYLFLDARNSSWMDNWREVRRKQTTRIFDQEILTEYWDFYSIWKVGTELRLIRLRRGMTERKRQKYKTFVKLLSYQLLDLASEKPKILCLSFHRPPAVRPQAILIGKMIPEWLRQGCQPVIASIAAEGKWEIDAPVYDLPAATRPNRLLNRVPWLARRRRQQYLAELYGAVHEIIQKEGINMVFSYAKPHLSNVLGAMVKALLDIPFVSHFSDPWEYISEDQKAWVVPSVIPEEEGYIVRNSNRIVFIHEKLKDFVMAKYPSELQAKATVVPHCIDPTEYPPTNRAQAEKFIISHLGIFRHNRNPEVLLKAVADLLKRRPDLRLRALLQFVGSNNTYTSYQPQDLTVLIARYGLEKNVSLLEPVSFQASLQLMRDANLLVVIDTNTANCPFILSKSIDYAGSGTPIVGIMPADNPTAEFITELGFQSFTYDQVQELASYIERVIDGGVPLLPNPSVVQAHYVQNTTARLLGLCQEVWAESVASSSIDQV